MGDSNIRFIVVEVFMIVLLGIVVGGIVGWFISPEALTPLLLLYVIYLVRQQNSNGGR